MAKFIALLVFSFITHPMCSGNGGESGRFQERVTGGVAGAVSNHYRGVCLVGHQTLCVANILTPWQYLTAAHCVPLPGTLGEYIMLAGRRWCFEENFKICPRSILVIRHPRYVPGRVGGHDLALIKANMVMHSHFHETRLATLPFNHDYKECFAWGKGATIWDPTKQIVRHSGKTELVTFNRTLYHHIPFIGELYRWDEGMPRNQSWTIYAGYYNLNMTARHGSCGHYPTYLQRRILCGNRVQGPKGEPVGLCYGDGGAPLMCNVKEIYHVFGIFSMIAPVKAGLDRLPFYNTCGNVDYIDIFMYLCPYYGWLKSLDPAIRLEIPPQGCGELRPSANFAVLAAFFALISKSPIST